MTDLESPCPFFIRSKNGGSMSVSDLQKQLEAKSCASKIAAMKDLIEGMLNNPEQAASYDKLLMTVIRFVVPSNNHELKKLSQLYWEVVPKLEKDGSMRAEMILACNALRNDLIHANEYIRGSCMRALSKIDNKKVLEPLVEDIVTNLNHTHPYVRRNAVICTHAVMKQFGVEMIPNGLANLESVAESERDIPTQRAALLALVHCAPLKALECLRKYKDGFSQISEATQLAVAELVKEIGRIQLKAFPSSRSFWEIMRGCPRERLVKILIGLCDSGTPPVIFEAASTLLDLDSSNPQALRTACTRLASLLSVFTDNNIRLAILGRLHSVSLEHPRILEGISIDILRVLSSPSPEVRELVLQCALPAMTRKTSQDVVQILKKELIKSLDAQSHGIPGHRHNQKQLIRAIRTVAASFPETASAIVDLMCLFLAEPESSSSIEVALLLRELVASNTALRTTLMSRLVDSLPEITNPRIFRVALWILGEFLTDSDAALAVINEIYDLMDSLRAPSVGTAEGKTSEVQAVAAAQASAITTQPQVKMSTRTVILPDGTYGTENVYETIETGGSFERAKVSNLFTVIYTQKERLVAAILAACCVKLCFRCNEHHILQATNKSVVIIAAMLRYFKSFELYKSDVVGRLTQCLKMLLKSPTMTPEMKKETLDSLCSGTTTLKQIVASQTYGTYREDQRVSSGSQVLNSENYLTVMLGQRDWTCSDTGEVLHGRDDSTAHKSNKIDAPLTFRQLGCSNSSLLTLSESQVEGPGQANVFTSVSKALTGDSKPCLQKALNSVTSTSSSKILDRTFAMSGLGDPVYVEATTSLVHYDMVVQLFVANRTQDTLQNVSVELCTHGDLRVVEKPRPVTIPAGGCATVSSTIHLNSTETGVLFGYVSFEKKSAIDKEFLVLNELQIDILDCLVYSWMSDFFFRSLWTEFEWENKICLNVNTDDPFELVKALLKETKGTLVGVYSTPPSRDSNGSNVHSEAEALSYCVSLLKNTKPFSGMQNSSLFAVNICARSIFGEDALMNVSIERHVVSGSQSKLSGNVRIRSRSQGIALSLGDRIGSVQRQFSGNAIMSSTGTAAALLATPPKPSTENEVQPAATQALLVV